MRTTEEIRAYKKEWRDAHRAETRIKMQEWYQKNKEKVRAKARVQYWSDPEAAKKKHNQYVKDNAVKIKAYWRKYYHENKPAYIEIMKEARKGYELSLIEVRRLKAEGKKVAEVDISTAYLDAYNERKIAVMNLKGDNLTNRDYVGIKKVAAKRYYEVNFKAVLDIHSNIFNNIRKR